MVSADKVKQLRAKTGSSMMECKKALTEAHGDEEKALKILQEKGRLTAMKKSERKAEEGVVEAYIHGNKKIGVLLKLKCETDFVAKTDDFKEFAKNIAMHIAASRPLGIVPEDVPPTVLEKEKEIYRHQAKEMGKPENMLEKIVEGKMSKFYKESCLMQQPFVRDPNLSIADVLNDMIAKTGEKITISRFARFQIGE